MAKPLSFTTLLQVLRTNYPDIDFVSGKAFCWSPATRQIVYRDQQKHNDTAASYSLLHELGHAQLAHQRYQLDFELLQLEVAAWEQARLLALDHDIVIDEDHIQNCLDTYRDWLYRRSICPTCTTKALQQDNARFYRCFNCHATWKVAPSRFCRPYRQTKGQPATPVFADQF